MSILVAGATGTVGRHVVNHLVAAGQRVRALTRNPAQASFPAGVDVVRGDLSDPASLAAAMDGATAMHLINFDGATGGLLEHGPELVEMARQAGIRRVTVLLGGDKGPLEQAIETSDLEWTFLAPVEFMLNALEWTAAIRDHGLVEAPQGDRKTAAIHEGDIGAVAAVVLVQGGYGGETLTITGPDVLTPRMMVRTLAEVLGREIRFVELTHAEQLEHWQVAGFSADDIAFFEWALYNTPEIGMTVAPTVERVTGRKARTFHDWATDHADMFR